MKTVVSSMKKSAFSLFATRLLVATAFLSLFSTFGMSQSLNNNVIKTNDENSRNSQEKLNTGVLETSKTNGNLSYPGFNLPSANANQKIALHAPDINDPDYAAKKAEWIKNYPDEYNAAMSSSSHNQSKTNDYPAFTIKSNAQKLSTHAPDLNDPDYAAKKTEWIKNYPDEYLNSVIVIPANAGDNSNNIKASEVDASIQKTNK